MLLETPRPRHEALGPTVAVYLFDGISVFEVGCVTEVFALPRPELDVPWYTFQACAETTGPMRALGGFGLLADHDMAQFAAADTVIVTAVPNVRGEVSRELVRALREAYERGARVVSICSGAFALAEAGLLDGLRATTHWRYAEVFAARYPKVHLDPDVLYVDEGRVLTSAGSAAGLDLCLHLVRQDHGSAVANAVARRLVLPPHRGGGLAQLHPAFLARHWHVAAALAGEPAPRRGQGDARDRRRADRAGGCRRRIRRLGHLPPPLHPGRRHRALGLPPDLPRLSGQRSA